MNGAAVTDLHGARSEARFCAELALARSAAAAAGWLHAAAALLARLPPAGLVVDLGVLLTAGRLPPATFIPSVPALAGALRRCEDQLLARYAADPLFGAAVVAVGRLSPGEREEAVAWAVEALLHRIHWQPDSDTDWAQARRLLRRPIGELRNRGIVALTEDQALAPELAAVYDGLARHARQARRLLGSGEAFVLGNFSALDSGSRRLACNQAAEAAGAFDRDLPRHLEPGTGPGGAWPSSQLVHDLLPMGGFAGLTHRGQLENLIPSELVYLEPGAGLDLFDVRWAEGELLYYLRDESPRLRRRQTLTVVLTAALTAARIMDRGLPWRRSILMLGLLVAAVRRLEAWLVAQALSVRIVFADPEALAEERLLLGLLLAAQAERGLVAVGGAANVEAALEEAHAAAARGRSDLVIVGGAEVDAPPIDPLRPGAPGVATLDLSGPLPRLRWWPAPPIPAADEPWETWLATARELMRGLL